MELSAAVSDGVQVAGSASLDEKNFQELVKQSVRCTLEPDACTSATEGMIYNSLSSLSGCTNY